MSLENRLKELGIKHNVPMDNLLAMYEGRYKALHMAFGREYHNRDSHLRVKAFQGLEMYLKNRYKQK